MSKYTVTAANWNSAAFWSSISEGSGGHALDFGALGSAYSVSFDQANARITLSDGSTTSIAKDSASVAGAFNQNATACTNTTTWNSAGGLGCTPPGGGVATGGSNEGDGNADTIHVGNTLDGRRLLFRQFDLRTDQVCPLETPDSIGRV